MNTISTYSILYNLNTIVWLQLYQNNKPVSKPPSLDLFLSSILIDYDPITMLFKLVNSSSQVISSSMTL